MFLSIINEVMVLQGAKPCIVTTIAKERLVRASLLLKLMSAFMLLAAKQKPGHEIVPVNIKNYCPSSSSLTYDIAKIDNYSLYRQLGNENSYKLGH